jgi:alkanesulfonate monooxygenase SsuD/methylene tetrahydromethanopterin reductase-like flavin-dependent oxidoreductase (luciferase family)
MTSALRAAEDISLLHLLTDGRAEFGLGMGVTEPGSIETRPEKVARYNVILEDVLRLLDGDTSTGLPEVSPQPDPAIKSKLWVAARDPAALATAARHGLNFVVGQAEIAERQAPYVRRYREAGGTGMVRGVRIAFVAPTRAEALRDSEPAVRTYFAQLGGRSYHKEAVDAGALPASADTLDEIRRQVSFIAGTPDEVADELNAYIDEVQVNRLDVMVQLPGIPTEMVRRSLTLINDEVRPRLKMAPRPH